MNAIGVIVPYKYEGLWVFDDPAVGLVREPFVSGIDTMIDKLVAGIPNADLVLLPHAAHMPQTQASIKVAQIIIRDAGMG